ncbi:sigma 54-interacting transcriptional regulator, partial [Thermodesulfobacteriota bacterium]
VVRRIAERRRHESDGRKISELMDQCYHEFISVFSFSNLPAFRKNADLVTIDVNAAMAELLGIPAKEILNRSDEELWGPKLAARLLNHCAFALRGETVLVDTTREIGGEQIDFIDQFYPDWAPNHRIKGVCGILAPRPTGPAISEDNLETREQTSSAMQEVYLKAQLAAQHDCNVMLTGESGTGKDFLARKIHELSKRSSEPFENFNCAALQKDLAGSELFGHEAGAFTGAKAMRRGIFELADRGTVFLNEIGDMPLDLQPKLLTVLETRSFRRVGGEKLVPLGARIIAATNIDLNKEMGDRLFRKDLYHRLTVFTIRVPPLRERLGELPGLVENLTQRIASEMGLETVPELDTLSLAKLRSYRWPGNIRELRNVLERSFIHSGGSSIGPEHIVFQSEESLEETTLPKTGLLAKIEDPPTGTKANRMSAKRPRKPSQEELIQLHREFITEKGWTRARLADHLGVHSSTLKKWFKAAGLPAGRRGRPRKSP